MITALIIAIVLFLVLGIFADKEQIFNSLIFAQIASITFLLVIVGLLCVIAERN